MIEHPRRPDRRSSSASTSSTLGEGRASFELDPGERHYNPLGTVHGGIAATLLDSAMGCAVHTTLGEGEIYTTLELKVNYVRAITAGHRPGRRDGLGHPPRRARGDRRGAAHRRATGGCSPTGRAPA